MKKPYKIVSGASTPNSRELAGWLAKDGQLLIPLVELLEKGERAIDDEGSGRRLPRGFQHQGQRPDDPGDADIHAEQGGESRRARGPHT